MPGDYVYVPVNTPHQMMVAPGKSIRYAVVKTHPSLDRRLSMLKNLKPILLGCLALALATPAFAQVKQTREQMMFYTSQWKGERFPDGRPKVSDDLLKRVVDVSIEDLWDYLRDKGYNCQFDTGFQMLHPGKALRRPGADGAIHAAAPRHV